MRADWFASRAGRRRPGRVPAAVLPLAIVLLTGACVPAVALAVDATTTTIPSPSATAIPSPADTVAPSPAPSDPAATTPVPTPDPVPSPTPTASQPPAVTVSPAPTLPAPTAPATVNPAPTPSSPPAPTATPSPTRAGLYSAGTILATLPDDGGAAAYLAPGASVVNALPFQSVRYDVLVANGSPTPVAWTPRLEYRLAGTGDFALVPTQPLPGVPFHATTEWVAVAGGTETGPESAIMPAAAAHLPAPIGLTAADGRRVSGQNPDSARTLPATSVSEQEFTVGITIDAAFGARYELRVTDAGAVVPDGAVGVVELAAAPAIAQSAGQRSGVASGAAAKREAMFPLVASLSQAGPTPAYSLLPGQTQSVGPGATGTVHQPYASTTSDQCSVCHSTHRAQAQSLIAAASATQQCYLCHGPAGLGGPMDVQTGFSGGPANDPSTRSYYSHDLAAGGHTLASENEFQGTLNRHSQCADCHNPHDLSSQPDAYSSATHSWTVSGSYGGASGVAVTNGAAGTAPSYALLDGVVNPVTSEYQLCLKCHSGFTALPANDPAKPSRDFTDLGVAFNPNNLSYHPVEAAGRNQSTKMADSLSGSSQYKIWNLTTADTVRCVMCHTSGSTPNTSPTAANLSVHASANRGILVRPYEDRVLSVRGRFYEAAGFALCLACHAETPYMNPSGPGATTATNFEFHGLHVAGISTRGSGGTDIDTPGAGQGNARCAECHFRSHSTTDAVPGQTLSGDGLVNFAPDVTASRAMGGRPTYTATATGGTCTLTCHGKDHQEVRYVS